MGGGYCRQIIQVAITPNVEVVQDGTSNTVDIAILPQWGDQGGNTVLTIKEAKALRKALKQAIVLAEAC